MALTTGEFHTITISASSAAAWSLLGTYPDMPAKLVETQAQSLSIVVYCVDAPTGQLAFEGGQVVGLVDSVLASVSAPLSTTTVTDTASGVTEWGEDGSGDVWVYSSLGTLTRYDAAEVAVLKAWLP